MPHLIRCDAVTGELTDLGIVGETPYLDTSGYSGTEQYVGQIVPGRDGFPLAVDYALPAALADCRYDNGVIRAMTAGELAAREAAAAVELLRESIKAELAALDLVVTRPVEDLYAATGATPYPDVAAVIARKDALRDELAGLDV